MYEKSLKQKKVKKMAKFILTSSRVVKSFRFGADCAGCEPEGALLCVER
jgi:hypothetical protein